MPILSVGGLVVPPRIEDAPPVSTADVPRGLEMSWEGWDGSIWPLSDPTEGVFLTGGGGLVGLTMPEVTYFSSVSPSQNGSRFRGYRVPDRSNVSWPVLVYTDDSSEEWARLDAAFWQTMRPGKTGVWRVRKSDGTSRTMTLRWQSEDPQYTNDPLFQRWCLYAIGFTADDPFWRGDPIVRTFRQDPTLGFFDGPGVINIGSGSNLSTATITNPGDDEASVVWSLSGPWATAQVGVDGSIIQIPFPAAVGESLTIWTQDDLQVAIDGNGVDRTAELGAADFVGVAAGANVPLSLGMTGYTSSSIVEATIIPPYYRAW